MGNTANPTDSSLILQYLEGDSSVLPILVKRHHKDFCKKAYWITKDAESAKDAAQESWIIIIRNLHTLKNVDRFKSWAHRIVYNKAIDGLNRRSNESKQLKSHKFQESNEHLHDEIKEDRLNIMIKAIRELPQGKQEIIRLFYMEEYSISDISTFLNIPLGTVKSRLYKAREKLKSIIKKHTS